MVKNHQKQVNVAKTKSPARKNQIQRKLNEGIDHGQRKSGHDRKRSVHAHEIEIVVKGQGIETIEMTDDCTGASIFRCKETIVGATPIDLSGIVHVHPRLIELAGSDIVTAGN